MLAKLSAFARRWRRLACEIAAVLVALGIFAFMGQKLTHMQGLMTNDHQPLFGDFIAFWSAGKIVLSGKAAMVHNPDLIHQVQLAAIPHLPVVAPWNSPPQFLLFATLLGLMSYPVAAAVFLLVCLSAYFAAARKILPDWRALIFAAALPAVVFEIGSIQTGIIIAAIYGLSLYWQDRRPIAGGALIGLLTIKPHLAVLWPFYLALTGRWRMFAAAAASTIVITVAGGLAFGFESYVRFLQNIAYTQNLITGRHVSAATYGSLYGNLLGLGVPNMIAITSHAASALLALTLAFFIVRRGGAAVAGAAMCAATTLTSPYLFFYDMTILGVALAFLGAPRKWWEWPAFVLGWGAGLSVAVGFYVHLPVAPVAAWAVLLTAGARVLFTVRPAESEPAPVPEQNSEPAAAA